MSMDLWGHKGERSRSVDELGNTKKELAFDGH